MKKFLLAGVALLALCGEVSAENTIGPSNQVLCSNLAQATTSAATTSQVLSLVGASGSQPVLRGVTGKTIFICGWQVTNSTAATNGTFQFVAGTDAATTPGCGGTQTILTPPLDVTNTAPATDHVSVASLNLAAGQQLCVTTTGAVTLHIGVWIGQY